ncbi:hypothetical protein JZM24_01170 [Candidatus Sodalis endolongispinus]|uniref:Uncharacterized protein n=1 Tax=Candidatus Sodalis endolongispinus TaxID=2812662 RepID=A0ABS5Y7Z8_9GAMM|nr:hypothetical protein [Candidatus Sodalis endolongispinus]MBT9431125.1 hypothetical protein [Candidatus Sodalis endolongispinus]
MLRGQTATYRHHPRHDAKRPLIAAIHGMTPNGPFAAIRRTTIKRLLAPDEPDGKGHECHHG